MAQLNALIPLQVRAPDVGVGIDAFDQERQHRADQANRNALMDFRQSEAERSQANADRSFALRQQTAQGAASRAERSLGMQERASRDKRQAEMMDGLYAVVMGSPDQATYEKRLTSFAKRHDMDPAKMLAENPFDQLESNIRESFGMRGWMEYQQKNQTAGLERRLKESQIAENEAQAAKQQQEVRQEAQKTERRQDFAQRNAAVVVQDIDRALEIVRASPNLTTGVGGQLLSMVGGTDARDVSALMDTIKANAGFDRLQAMREASPTGGALGQVSNLELGQLNAAIGSLEQSQSAEQFEDNLLRVKNLYLDIIHGPGQGPGRQQPGFEQQQGGPAPVPPSEGQAPDPLGIRY